MPSVDQLRRAVAWAAREVGIRQPPCTKAKVLPWSATASLGIGQHQYWVKVSSPRNSTVESRILTVARDLRLSTVPTLVSSSDGLNAILMEHIRSYPSFFRSADVVASKNRVCAALTTQAKFIGLAALTASGCGEIIVENCRRCRSSWIDETAAYTLAKTVEAHGTELADLDGRIPRVAGVVHGDFHPGNVLVSSAGPVLIDWADAAYGAEIWDQATFEMSSNQLEYIDGKSNVDLNVIAGLKEMSDFLLTPQPVRDDVYSVSISHLRFHISRRAAALIRSLNLLRQRE